MVSNMGCKSGGSGSILSAIDQIVDVDLEQVNQLISQPIYETSLSRSLLQINQRINVPRKTKSCEVTNLKRIRAYNPC